MPSPTLKPCPWCRHSRTLGTTTEHIDAGSPKRDNLGSPTIDAPGWRRFRDNLKAELEDRRKKRGEKC